MHVRRLIVDSFSCRKLLYEMVKAWEYSPNPNQFELQILNTFGSARLEQILRICLPLEFAQSLYPLPAPTSCCCFGHHGTCSWNGNIMYALLFPDELSFLNSALQSQLGSSNSDMKHCLLKVLHTPRFRLLKDTEMARWSSLIQASSRQDPEEHPHNSLSFLSDEGGGAGDSVVPVVRIPKLSTLQDVWFGRYRPKPIPNLVFMCHTGADKELVRQVNGRLVRLGIPTFHDEQNIRVGNNISERVYSAIVGASYALIFLSRQFFERQWPQDELKELLSRQNQGDRLILLPVVIDMTHEELERKAPRQLTSIAYQRADTEDRFRLEKVMTCVLTNILENL
ncbi:hypothetical protein ACA910_016468 [Epithemia clementina (nom. ined.)]